MKNYKDTNPKARASQLGADVYERLRRIANCACFHLHSDCKYLAEDTMSIFAERGISRNIDTLEKRARIFSEKAEQIKAGYLEGKITPRDKTDEFSTGMGYWLHKEVGEMLSELVDLCREDN